MKLRIFSPATGELACNYLDAKRDLAPAEPTRNATLYRMVLPDHICPFGVRARRMLEEHGFTVEDRILTSREDVDALKAEHGVDITPLVFIDGERISGSDELARYLVTQGTKIPPRT
jgi:glutaredoxin 3